MAWDIAKELIERLGDKLEVGGAEIPGAEIPEPETKPEEDEDGRQ